MLRQVEQDRINLSELVGYEVEGMAYPCGGANCNERIAEIIKNNTCIKYALTIGVTKSSLSIVVVKKVIKNFCEVAA